MSRPKAVQGLFWTDIETTGLPTAAAPNDYSTVYPLEIAVILTDLDLNPLAGYQTVLRPTPEVVAKLRENPEVVEMHKTSGLLKDLKGETSTLAEAQADIIALLKDRTTFDKGEFAIAGSGVATFDLPLIRQHFPEVASWLAYFPFDVGIFRRLTKIYGHGQDVYNPHLASFGASKMHRALEDVKAHLEEAGRQRDAMVELLDRRAGKR